MRKCSKPEVYIYLVMNKPAGFVCSAVSDSHKTVYDLLTPELKGLVCGAPRGSRLHTVGRLDCDTSGLLLLTNDGKFSHVITAGRVTKTYCARLKLPLSAAQQEAYKSLAAAGLTLPPEKKYGEQKAAPAELTFTADNICEITVCEGKFHEVRRIFCALGNEVVGLERIAIGRLSLPEALAPGQWRKLELDEMERLSGQARQ